MKTARKTRLRFADFPTRFAGLCALHTPRPIRDKADYANTVEITDAMAAHADDFSSDQEDYFDLLCMLLEAWDASQPRKKEASGLDALLHLLEANGLSGADLSRILGTSRQLGPMILRGSRAITATHARLLGKYFGLPAGVFIE